MKDSSTQRTGNYEIDVTSNRAVRKWSRKELIGRILWFMIYPLFRLSPRPLWGWRRAILRCFGAQLGENVHVYPSVRIIIPWNIEIGDYAAVGDHAILYALGHIRIGARSVVSQGAHICAGTHDWRDATMPLIKSPITIGDDVWVCADAFVGPGAIIGRNAIVGARAVVVKDVPVGAIVAGNPARQIGLKAS